MIDSNPNVASAVGDRVKAKVPAARELGEYLLVPSESFLALIEEPAVFVHFDEIYLCNYVRKPQIVIEHFTSDRADFGEAVPETFLTQFVDLPADAYVSDGCGLNFAFKEANSVSLVAEAEALVSSDRTGGLPST